MKLYLIRHGESETNRDGLWTGWLDVSLTDNGEKDALFARSVLSSVSIDKVYASDLCRAVRTAEIALPGCRPAITSLLREIDVGSLTGKPLGAKTDDGQNAGKNGYAAYGGESRDQFRERVQAFLDAVANTGEACIAAFTHAGFLRTALDIAVGLDLPRKNILCKNCAIAVLENESGIWKLHSLINQP